MYKLRIFRNIKTYQKESEIKNPQMKQKNVDMLKQEGKEQENNLEVLINLKKGQELQVQNYEIKESETTPPTRYNSGSIILAMENAGKLIE